MTADRDETPSLVKMLLTWRATVFSLITSSSAIARFVLPVATRRTTSSSRAVSPPAALRRGAPRELLHAAEVRAGAELPEHAAGRVELHLAGVLVPELPAGEPDQDAGARGLVRRPELLPRLARLTERDQGGPGVAVRQGDRSPRVRHHRAEHAAAVALRDLLELEAGAARLLDDRRRPA